ncbi:cytochrome c biogenesis protein ResB [Geotalea sp. SG265]|uniref:cytochrome c biogenesis protein ResB n=1 Tax=Geotalea sp. SG265 TaxID=2922867 RepID=UPI001FAE8DDC|nr:cytochrome c biogenesis protein ResB [Geotalea sp. SG265]
MINKLIKIFGSLRFTVGIVIGLVAVFIVGLIVPQKSMIGLEAFHQWQRHSPELVSFLEALSLTDIYSAPLVLCLWGLFFLNLLVVMSHRIPLIWRRCMDINLPSSQSYLDACQHRSVIAGKGIDAALVVLRQHGYRVFQGDNTFWAVKNRYAPVGTILFHISFLLLLLGGVLTFYTSFRGEAAVATGETFTGEYTKRKLPKIGSVPATSFTVEKIVPTYFNQEVPVDLKVYISSPKGLQTCGINRPFHDGELSFVVMDIDVAPLFILKDLSGAELDSAFVKLKVLQGKEDSFKMGGYTFKTLFHTDVLAENSSQSATSAGLPEALKRAGAQQAQVQSRQIVNPAFTIAVYDGDRLLHQELVKPGGEIVIGNKRLVFADLAYWVRLYAGMEQGLAIVYSGFGLMIIALTMRLLFYRRELWGMVCDEELHLAGRSEYFTALFTDEFQKVTAALNSPT